ncbi:GGDEF domain-containing protein [Proteiniclasticum ruminis]|uniref:Diguanylate cyclase (GGDEF) domain-containing protein n=1 Tax=Proteiniclasticum ruminis TaxID=398199 RepID=A0A1I5D7G7_9CLOT|nr:bifunctional diguanylate cyclase/phosphodiesterase [Proteiniclasticum ruminis]SFN95133.1 diguanylate cyclase (GGDEF) domain-containing protein [Proteiniclasticum ruminis]
MTGTMEALSRIIAEKKLYAVFQPILSLSTGTILGYEALSRISEDGLFSSPEELFIAAKEQNRLWELEQLARSISLKAARCFMAPPISKKLFLNVNPHILQDDSFIRGFTKEFLMEYGISPRQVIFEITERNVISDMKSFKTIICHYKSQDYTIAIDDVGAGYSGLNLISDVDPTFIKIDMKLIRDIHVSPLKRAIVKGLMEFSKASKIMLIAEGVETYEELDCVLHLGVQYAQGYLIKKPEREITPISSEVLDFIHSQKLRKNPQSVLPYSYQEVRHLAGPIEILSPKSTVFEAYHLLKLQKDSLGICILQDSKVEGILTREKLSLLLSGQYGFTLNQNKPLSQVMDKDFLSVEGSSPVNLVSSLAMERSQDKLYDFIVVEEKERYFGVITIKDLLEKSYEMELYKAKHQNPLTGLPGNLFIEQKLHELVKKEKEFYAYYLDIDHFKAFNDVYGFEKGDLVIRLLADSLTKELPSHQFIGHIGGDDFVVLLNDPSCIHKVLQAVERFEKEILSFYTNEDRTHGYIHTENRNGYPEKFPLMTLTAVCVRSAPPNHLSLTEISERLAKEKVLEKKKKNKIHHREESLA